MARRELDDEAIRLLRRAEAGDIELFLALTEEPVVGGDEDRFRVLKVLEGTAHARLAYPLADVAPYRAARRGLLESFVLGERLSLPPGERVKAHRARVHLLVGRFFR
jgi:hypothetical protein